MLFYAVSIAATFVAAWASYHLYEKHFLKMKRFFRTRPVPAKKVASLPRQADDL
jgi:peptidoglycan/LPS O-acetylase OafA/YrhL